MDPEIKHLVKKGYQVQAFTPYHFRINGKLDMWPGRRRRFHNRVNGERGQYPLDNKDLVAFMEKQLAVSTSEKPADVLPGKRWLTAATQERFCK
jgi:hypothetical protein